MDRRYQVKQYVAEVETKTSLFHVFKTGDEKYYLFAQVNPKTKCDTGLQFPVLKSRLRKDVGRALKNGFGYRMVKN